MKGSRSSCTGTADGTGEGQAGIKHLLKMKNGKVEESLWVLLSLQVQPWARLTHTVKVFKC